MNLLGLDLGQVSDPSAFCYLKQVESLLSFRPPPMRCLVTKELYDASKWKRDPDGNPIPCRCKVCQAQWKKEHTEPILADIKPTDNPYKKPDPGVLTDKLHPHLAGDPEFDLPEDKAQVQPPHTDTIRSYECLDFRKFPLGTSYVDIVKLMQKLCQHPIIVKGPSVLVVDQTGVGRAVVDMLRRAKLGIRIVPITITFGKEALVKEELNEIHVPKKDIVGVLETLMEQGRFGVASRMPDIEQMLQEWRTFKFKKTKAGNETYGAEGQDHDDVILALAVACWYGEKKMQRVRVF